MKKTATPNVKSRGYPLNCMETARPKFPGPAEKIPEKATALTMGKQLISSPDVPENWDESWFANYE